MLGGDSADAVSRFYGMGQYGSYDPNNPYSNIRSSGYGDNPGDDLYADLIRAQTRDYNQELIIRCSCQCSGTAR
jgi:hypothetical protein